MMLEDRGFNSSAQYSPQFEETETLHIRLQSTSKDLLSYIKQRMEAFKKYKSYKVLTFEDPSSAVSFSFNIWISILIDAFLKTDNFFFLTWFNVRFLHLLP
jgi:hypothetical protein